MPEKEILRREKMLLLWLRSALETGKGIDQARAALKKFYARVL